MYGRIKGDRVIDTNSDKCPHNVKDIVFFSLDDYEEYQKNCRLKKDEDDTEWSRKALFFVVWDKL